MPSRRWPTRRASSTRRSSPATTSQLLHYATQKVLPDTPRTTIVACLLQGNAAYWAHLRRLAPVPRCAPASRRAHGPPYTELQETLSQVVPIGERASTATSFTCPGSPGKQVVDAVGPLLLQRGDHIPLCSDGLWSNVGDADVTEQLAERAISDAVPELVEMALRSGGARCDNVTVLAVEWGVGRGTATARSGSRRGTRRRCLRPVDDPGPASPGQDVADELDEAEIERSIREINARSGRTLATGNPERGIFP